MNSHQESQETTRATAMPAFLPAPAAPRGQASRAALKDLGHAGAVYLEQGGGPVCAEGHLDIEPSFASLQNDQLKTEPAMDVLNFQSHPRLPRQGQTR